MCEILYVVIPCFNEEEILRGTAELIDRKISTLIENRIISDKSRVLFVNDGSKDNTWRIVKQLHSENKLFTGISLAHNSGEQNAYVAGMMTAKNFADFVITMDADLQDDINAVDEMIAKYYEGNDIVYGVRASRENEPLFIRTTARAFYKVMKLMGTELIPNHSQYRLMSRRTLDALALYEEKNLFLPALIPLLGYRHSIVYHGRNKRMAGKSKYAVKSLFRLASEAISSFSLRPIHLINYLGVLSLLIFMGILGYSVFQTIAGKFDGWLLVLASVWAVGGALLLGIGIIGEYIGKTYLETKKRPRYFIAENLLET
jgi:polyisoprenyl-phosphate glycosyltransferase